MVVRMFYQIQVCIKAVKKCAFFGYKAKKSHISIKKILWKVNYFNPVSFNFWSIF